MAATVSIAQRTMVPNGQARMNVVNITGDNAYSAGGYTITANALGLNKITAIIPCGAAFNTATTGRAVLPVINAAGTSVDLRLLGMGASAAVTVGLTETSTADQSLCTF